MNGDGAGDCWVWVLRKYRDLRGFGGEGRMMVESTVEYYGLEWVVIVSSRVVLCS